MNKKCVTFALKTSLPVFFGYLALGIAYGLVVVEAGYPWWLAPVSGLTMFAGAGQFVAIGLFSAATPLHMILLTELLINIRHIVYGLSLITKFQNCGKWKPYLIFALTDETYSLLTTTDIPEGINPPDFYGLVSLFDQCWWVLGGIIGSLAGYVIPFDMAGVDFALTALFAVLTVEQIIKSKDFVPPLAGGLATLLAIVLWRFGKLGNSSNILLVALALGLAVTTLVKTRKPKSEQKQQQEETNESD